MRYISFICLLLSLALVSGCASRYETFTLVEGSVDEATSSSSVSSSDPNLHEQFGENAEDRLQLKRQILVDRKTGKLYYFDGLNGPLKSFSENK